MLKFGLGYTTLFRQKLLLFWLEKKKKRSKEGLMPNAMVSMESICYATGH